MDLEDMKSRMATLAVIVISFLLIGKLAGLWLDELFIIGFLWIVIAFCWAFLAITVGERFEQMQPLLLSLALGLAWVCVWGPLQRLAVDKAGFSGLFKPDLLPPSVSMSLPWWSSLSFKLIVLVVLVAGGYGFGYLRANR